MRISDWSSDVCSSDLLAFRPGGDNVPYRREEMLLEGSTQLLDNNSFGAWIFPLLEPQGDAPRHCAQGRQPRYQIAQHPGRALVADCCERRFRSEGRRVGKEWVRTCRSRWSPEH